MKASTSQNKTLKNRVRLLSLFAVCLGLFSFYLSLHPVAPVQHSPDAPVSTTKQDTFVDPGAAVAADAPSALNGDLPATSASVPSPTDEKSATPTEVPKQQTSINVAPSNLLSEDMHSAIRQEDKQEVKQDVGAQPTDHVVLPGVRKGVINKKIKTKFVKNAPVNSWSSSDEAMDAETTMDNADLARSDADTRGFQKEFDPTLN